MHSSCLFLGAIRFRCLTAWILAHLITTGFSLEQHKISQRQKPQKQANDDDLGVNLNLAKSVIADGTDIRVHLLCVFLNRAVNSFSLQTNELAHSMVTPRANKAYSRREDINLRFASCFRKHKHIFAWPTKFNDSPFSVNV